VVEAARDFAGLAGGALDQSPAPGSAGLAMPGSARFVAGAGRQRQHEGLRAAGLLTEEMHRLELVLQISRQIVDVQHAIDRTAAALLSSGHQW
jgi:hypothetical protein